MNVLMIYFTQFKKCINRFGQEDVTPSNAVDILLIADRHRFDKLKKVRHALQIIINHKNFL